MTVEERTRKIFTEEDVDEVGSRYIEALQYRIAQALRDQIEDCAGIADRFLTSGDRHAAQLIGKQIRALAGKKEETEDDGPDDRFDLGGFECNEKQED
jgi:hypothetical protein